MIKTNIYILNWNHYKYYHQNIYLIRLDPANKFRQVNKSAQVSLAKNTRAIKSGLKLKQI